MTSHPGNSQTDALITLDRPTYEFWQQELARLRHENAELHNQLTECQKWAELKQAQSVLQESSQLLQLVLNTIPQRIFYKDLNHHYLGCNQLFAQDAGLASPEQIIGKRDQDLPWKDLADVFEAEDRAVIASDTPKINVEERKLNADGSTQWLSITKVPLHDKTGRVIGVFGSYKDISDHKQEQQRAETQYAVTRILSESTRLGKALPKILQTLCEGLEYDLGEFWSIDREANVLRCTATWHQPDVLKPEFTAVTQTIAFAPAQGLPGRVWATGEALWVADMVQEPDCLRSSIAAVEGLHGACLFPILSDQEVFGVMACFSQNVRARQDEAWLKVMTTLGRQIGQFMKRRQAEEQVRQQAQDLQHTLSELQKTQSQLIQTEKMSSLGQLVAGVAHEINNPVNFIYGNLDHIRQYTQDLLGLLDLYHQQIPQTPATIQAHMEAIDLEFIQEDLPKILHSMYVGTDRIRGIVQSLRTFSRLDEAEMKEVNLHEGIDSTLLILGNRLKAKSDRHEIRIVKEYGQLPPVECYPGQLNQVFMNILCNAIDALEESMMLSHHSASLGQKTLDHPPTITIRTEAIAGDRVRIVMADNGPGMSQTTRQRLFDPFFTTKPVGKGTGMGMSISYQIITEKHRGSLECHSSPGHGAEFVIEIPVRQ